MSDVSSPVFFFFYSFLSLPEQLNSIPVRNNPTISITNVLTEVNNLDLSIEFNRTAKFREFITPDVEHLFFKDAIAEICHATARSSHNINFLLSSLPCDVDILFKYSD